MTIEDVTPYHQTIHHETHLLHERVSFQDYVSDEPLSDGRSTSGFEVDFLIGDHTAMDA